MSSISIENFLRLPHDISIIDIRNREKYNDNHIPGAKNIDFDALLLRPNLYLQRGKTYYIYCQKGKSSLNLCQILNRQGYQTVSLIGGYEEWVMKH